MSVQRFRKKPVEIEAAQFDRSNGTLVAESDIFAVTYEQVTP